MLRAWYVFVALGLVTFVFTAFVGRVPVRLGAAVALPHNAPYRAGVSIRETVLSLTERRELRAEVARLETDVAQLRERNRQLGLQVERLGEALEVREGQTPGVVTTAPVIGSSASPQLSRLVVGKGREQGVVLNMPVSVPDGLVGLVTDVAPGSARVRTVVDPASRVGVTVRGKGGRGIAVGEIGERIRVSRFIPREPVAVGDEVETYSEGGLFPRGLLVGVVEEVLPPDPNDLRSSFIVRPAVDLSTLLEVVLAAPQ